ncbi:MAG: hypothetical protein ACLU5F_10380 [Anaerovoracaceae bacterium]
MEKTVRAIGICRWLGLPLGGIMFFFTYGSFGITIASVLSIMAAVSFWILMRSEQSRLIGQTIAREIKEAINEAGNVESYIEIKRLKSGIIARVYLINAREKVAVVNKAIARRLERCTFKKYLWIMQLTDMPGKSALRDTQRMLNDQLLEELMRKRRGDGN